MAQDGNGVTPFDLVLEFRLILFFKEEVIWGFGRVII